MRWKRCLTTVLMLLALAGCGASQGYYRPGFLPPQAEPLHAPNTRVQGALPDSDVVRTGAETRDAEGTPRKREVPNSVMLRDEGIGSYGDSLVPSS